MHSAVNSLSFDAAQFGTSRFILNAATGLGPWLISFAVGLLLSGISMLTTPPERGRRGALWKRALAIAWVPAFFFLYAGWRAEQSQEREEQALVKQIVEARNRLAKKAQADQSQFIAEFEALDVPSMLATDTLVGRSGIARNKVKLGQLAVLVDRQETLSRSNLLEFHRQLSELVSRHPRGPELRRSVDLASKARADLESKIVETQRKFIGVVSNLNDFMSARFGRVVAQGGIIRFETEAEAKAYNAYVMAATKLAQQEADLLAQLQQMVDRGSQTLDQLTR